MWWGKKKWQNLIKKKWQHLFLSVFLFQVKNCKLEGNSVLLNKENEKMGDKKERFTSPIKSRQFKSPREGKKKRGDDLVLPSRREKNRFTKK